MLLHQSDRLLIGPLTSQIMETFKINELQMGYVFSGALLVSATLYPLWGYLYDRYARSKLLALASFIWGSTTWVSAIAPSYFPFLVTRASTGIDDSSYPGLYSLISDYFGPSVRGKIYGLLEVAQPLGYILGLLVATLLSGIIGWRAVFYVTGSLGLVLAVVIFSGVKEAPRGKSEPELTELDHIGAHFIEEDKKSYNRNLSILLASAGINVVLLLFVWLFNQPALIFFMLVVPILGLMSSKSARGLFRKRSLIFLFLQGFVGVFPWNVITYWFFRYLEVERGYDQNSILTTMLPTVLVLASGYFIGGTLGDFLFKRTQRGRIFIAMTGVLLGAISLTLTMSVPMEEKTLFLILMIATALFIPFASPNVISTVYDITLPEVRSTSLAIQYYIENGGAAVAPTLAGFIAMGGSLHQAILYICVISWIIGFIFLACTAYLVPKDIDTLRRQMRERAELERQTSV